MKKESVIVGIFGLSLGLLVAWAIWNFKGAAPQPVELTLSPSPVSEEKVSTPTPPAFFLTIKNPSEDFVSTQSSLLVSGATKPETIIVILDSSDDYVLTASQDGSFSQEVNLEEGENSLTVTAYGPNEEETVERSVVYTKETLE